MTKKFVNETGEYFLCPKCLSINNAIVLRIYTHYEDWKAVANNGQIELIEKIESRDINEREKVYLMEECNCFVSEKPEDLIIFINIENKIIVPKGKYWKDNIKILEKIAEIYNFIII